jgi:hypothetical protein
MSAAVERTLATALANHKRSPSLPAPRARVSLRLRCRAAEAGPSPRRKSKLDSTQEAALVAVVCGPPPAGRSRWTIRLLTEHAVGRGVVDDVGRETVRMVLAEHELKAVAGKKWCVPGLNDEFVERMENVLELYARPFK